MPELGHADDVGRGHVVLQGYLHMELELASLPEPVLGTNDHVEVTQHVGIIKLDLDSRWFVILQLLNLKYELCDHLTMLCCIVFTSFINNLSLIDTLLLLPSSFFVLVGLLPSDSCLSLLVSVIIASVCICKIDHDYDLTNCTGKVH